LWLVTRDFDVFAPPDWSWIHEDGTFGNRFDNPGKYRGIPEEDRFRVIYCATQRAGGIGETIAHFRRSLKLLEGLRTIESDEQFEAELKGGVLSEEWRLGRRLGSTRLDEVLIFPTLTGTTTSGTNLLGRHFKPLLKKAELPQIRFHDLRRTCATILLMAGKHPKFVQELLGHATIAITLDTYSHVIEGMDGGLADAMDEAL
jgi:integrase